MQFQGKRVLILEGYARQSLALVQAFNKLSCNVSVLCGSKLDLCYWSRYVNKRILGICDRNLVKETEEQVRMLIQSHDYDKEALFLPLLMPLNNQQIPSLYFPTRPYRQALTYRTTE